MATISIEIELEDEALLPRVMLTMLQDMLAGDFANYWQSSYTVSFPARDYGETPASTATVYATRKD